MLYKKQRKKLVKYGKKLSRAGLCPGTSGNLSIFIPEEKLVLITPSGIDYEKTKKSDLVLMDLEGNIVEGVRKPSSEYHLHTLFYKNKKDAKALVHTHSVFATSIACMRMPIKAFHYQIADANTHQIPCAQYKRYGTEDLAKSAVKAAGSSKAVLLANHGLVVYDESIKKAYNLAKEVEYLAQIQYRTMVMGNTEVLSKDQIEEVALGFKTYGQK